MPPKTLLKSLTRNVTKTRFYAENNRTPANSLWLSEPKLDSPEAVFLLKNLYKVQKIELLFLLLYNCDSGEEMNNESEKNYSEFEVNIEKFLINGNLRICNSNFCLWSFSFSVVNVKFIYRIFPTATIFKISSWNKFKDFLGSVFNLQRTYFGN